MKIMSRIKTKWYQNQVDSRQERLQEQKQLLSRLNEDHAIVTDPAVKLEREIQIKRAKAEIEQIDNDVYLLKSALATGDDSKIPEQCKPKPAEKNTARRDQLDLLDNVKKGWIEGVLRQSLHNEVLIELKKTQDAAAVDRLQQNQPLNVTRVTDEAKPEQAVLLEDDIQEIYEEGKRTLLILGAPGAGKTISLLELTHRLAEDAEFDASQPIPVVFNLSSWAEKQQPLQDWLLDELWNKYRVSNKMGKGCLEKDALVLLLDGLDEVAAGQRDACVQAINIYREKYAQKGIVVACRIQEYRELADKLKLEQALCVQPLTEEQIKNYLAAGGEELAGLRTALESDAALQELASSPLMLSMMCLAYQHQTQEAVLQDVSGTAETRRTKLFAAYVQRMFQRPRRGAAYTEEQTRRWLTFLAYNMQKHGQTIFQIENLQPSWLLTKGGYWLYVMLSRGWIGILAAVGIFLFIIVTDGTIQSYYRVKYSEISMVIAWIIIGLPIGITNGTIMQRQATINKKYVYFDIFYVYICIFFIETIFMLLVTEYDESFYFDFSIINLKTIFILSLVISFPFGYLAIKLSLNSDIKLFESIIFNSKKFLLIHVLGTSLGFCIFALINYDSVMVYKINNNKFLQIKEIKSLQPIKFSPDSAILAGKNAEKKWVLYNTKTGRKLMKLGGSLMFSPAGKLIVTIDTDRKGQIWTQDGRKINEFGEKLLELAFSPDGKLIATIDSKGRGALWTQDGRKINEFGEKLNQHKFTPDSTLLITIDDNRKGTFWVTRDGGSKLNEMSGTKLQGLIEFSHDSTLIAVTDAHGKWIFWTRDGIRNNVLDNKIDNGIEFSPDGTLIVSSDARGILLFSTRDGRKINHFGENLYDLKFSPDGKLIATIDSEGKGLLWTRDGRKLNTLGNELGYQIEFSPDGTLIKAQNAYEKWMFWNREGVELNKLRNELSSQIEIKFSPDDTLIAARNRYGKWALWTRDGIKIKEFAGKVRGVTFSPDSKSLLLTSGYNFGPIVLFSCFLTSFSIALFASLRTHIFELSNETENEGIWRTLKSSLFLGFGFGMMVSLIAIFIEWEFVVLSNLFAAFVCGLLCGLPVAMWFGLMDFLKHFTLRFVLWLYGYAPWNYARFLDHATDRLFLRKVGGGYIFVHRLLLEYFAADETQLNLLFKKKTPQQQA